MERGRSDRETKVGTRKFSDKIKSTWRSVETDCSSKAAESNQTANGVLIGGTRVPHTLFFSDNGWFDPSFHALPILPILLTNERPW